MTGRRLCNCYDLRMINEVSHCGSEFFFHAYRFVIVVFPCQIVDLATLTGACIVALGPSIAGITRVITSDMTMYLHIGFRT